MGRGWWIVLVLSGCLGPRVCTSDADCAFNAGCEVPRGRDAGLCREFGDAGFP